LIYLDSARFLAFLSLATIKEQAFSTLTVIIRKYAQIPKTDALRHGKTGLQPGRAEWLDSRHSNPRPAVKS
jgi:hypothetical protein